MRFTIITGAYGGIGQALARRLSDRPLILHGRNFERLQRLESELDRSEETLLWAADLTEPELLSDSWARLFDSGETPEISGLVHNAGTVVLGAVSDQSVSDWNDAMDVNLISPAELTRLALPSLRATSKRPGGTVVFINSTSGLAANARWSSYAASKWGLRALADALRAEEAPHGVRVSTVYPSRTATTMQESVREMEGLPYVASDYLHPDNIAAAVQQCLDAPEDANVCDVTVRPMPRRSAGH